MKLELPKDFRKILNYQISWKSVQWEQTNLTTAFWNFANMTKKWINAKSSVRITEDVIHSRTLLQYSTILGENEHAVNMCGRLPYGIHRFPRTQNCSTALCEECLYWIPLYRLRNTENWDKINLPPRSADLHESHAFWTTFCKEIRNEYYRNQPAVQSPILGHRRTDAVST